VRVPVVIAVDGTAASGKGTLARRLAAHFGFAHLDSGSLYRLTALRVMESGKDLRRETDAIDAALAVDPARVNDPAIRTDELGQAASIVAAYPGVRSALLDFQRRFAAAPPGGAEGAVIDGRDIGTVVCPMATAKLYVDAEPSVRARRRFLELKANSPSPEEASVLADILARDRRDRERSVAPLKRAWDADLLDTTLLDIDAAFAVALGLVRPRIEEALKARHRG